YFTTLSLHDALPICSFTLWLVLRFPTAYAVSRRQFLLLNKLLRNKLTQLPRPRKCSACINRIYGSVLYLIAPANRVSKCGGCSRSEEHTSELQSREK